MKKQKQECFGGFFNPFDLLSEEIIFMILDLLNHNPLDRKSFALACKSLYATESKHRRTLKPLRQEHLPSVLSRYPNITHLDLTLCSRLTDTSLSIISNVCAPNLRSIDFSRSRLFSTSGLLGFAINCKNLVEIDLSNATDLKDSAMAAVAEAKNLEKLCLARCKSITDMGVGCIAVGCRNLRFICLKWCLGVGDLGVGLIAVKCKLIRHLDLSYLPITNKCLSSILKLQHLEDLVLEGCFGIDDDNLAVLEPGCKSLKSLDVSTCQNISHRGLSSLINGAEGLQQLTLAHGSPVTSCLADCLKKLLLLQSVKLDGCVITYDGLKNIGNWCASLRELSLSKCSGVTDEGLSSVVAKHKDLRKLDITCCRKITDVSIAQITYSCTSLTSLRMESCLKSISRCSKLASLKLGICLNITDEGLIHIGKGCSKLLELDLYRCAEITDLGISAIAQGCPGLEMINIAYCKDITDRSLLAASKCSRLKTFESRGCSLITSLGLTAIAVGCKELTKLDIKKCHNIDDAGMLPLAHFSQNLRQINLSHSSVTDVGLLSLASISCLQNITILHLEGLSPSGVAAALLACGGLTKVKLQAAFRWLLPHRLFEHLEARGCMFQWRDKVLQVELDPKCWKLQLEDPMP
ncbi:Leucine-rich repeat, cysteine-containing subtype [Corchorus capsularis]|uniref:Leucine-rich repeat, cysteine-containing subtype n=1 Tax=Corchorus capsularis TaxID=210143 RepID=A0A1R3IQT2_COCAP|nr:Leucine-rich repeat, cysteine-containing subtype [Corchorus capsularis]